MRKALIAAAVSAVAVCAFAVFNRNPARAAAGPCSDHAVNEERLQMADDAFSYMPAYGKPVIGKPAIREANTKNFSARTNVTRKWGSDHRVALSAGGDVAYEYGTLHMGYDEGGKRTEFDAVMLTVFKAKDGACQIAALTMQPLDEQPAR